MRARRTPRARAPRRACRRRGRARPARRRACARRREPASSSEFGSVFRRCANAASTTRLTRRSRPGSGRRRKATRAESTFGGGRKTVRETGWKPVRSAASWTSTETAPYAFVPGAAKKRSATSRCTITHQRSTRRQPVEALDDDRRRDVVRAGWRRACRAAGRGAARSSASASPKHDRGRSASARQVRLERAVDLDGVDAARRARRGSASGRRGPGRSRARRRRRRARRAGRSRRGCSRRRGSAGRARFLVTASALTAGRTRRPRSRRSAPPARRRSRRAPRRAPRACARRMPARSAGRARAAAPDTGMSVSARSRSAGTRAAAIAEVDAFGKVTLPANET